MTIITKQDCLDLLANDMQGLRLVYQNQNEAVKLLKATNKLDIFNFYDKLRRTYNEKHSKVYINLMKEVEEPRKVLSTISSLITLIMLYSEDIEYKQMFMRHCRLQDLLNALSEYAINNDLHACLDIIKQIKQDVKYFESI